MYIAVHQEKPKKGNTLNALTHIKDLLGFSWCPWGLGGEIFYKDGYAQ
jgi:hypothetical protein